MLIEDFVQEIRLLQPLHPQVPCRDYRNSRVFSIFSVMDPDNWNVEMTTENGLKNKKNRLYLHLLVLKVFQSLVKFSGLELNPWVTLTCMIRIQFSPKAETDICGYEMHFDLQICTSACSYIAIAEKCSYPSDSEKQHPFHCFVVWSHITSYLLVVWSRITCVVCCPGEYCWILIFIKRRKIVGISTCYAFFIHKFETMS